MSENIFHSLSPHRLNLKRKEKLMERIPITTKPHPDEILFSYLMRVKHLNLFDNKYFFEEVLQPDIAAYYKVIGKKYDFNLSLLPFIHLGRIKDPLSFYLSTSLYLFTSAFIRPEERAKILGYSLSDYSSYPYIWPKSKQTITTLKLCPHCIKEDIKTYGAFYHHRSHQPHGIEVCYKHQVPLLSYTGSPEEEFNLGLYKELPQNKDPRFSLLYAQLAHILLNPKSEKKEGLLKELKEKEDIDIFLEDVTNLATKNLFRFQREEKEKIRERVLNFIEKGYYKGKDLKEIEGVEILKTYQDDICLCKCKICGKEFISTKPALDIGYTCSCTREGKTSEEVVWDLVGVNEKDRYRLLYIPNFDYKSCLVMYDKACNSVFLIHPNNYLFKRFDRLKNAPKDIKKGPYKPISHKDLEALPYTIYVDDEIDSLTVECKYCGYKKYYSNKNTYITPCKICGWDESIEIIDGRWIVRKK